MGHFTKKFTQIRNHTFIKILGLLLTGIYLSGCIDNQTPEKISDVKSVACYNIKKLGNALKSGAVFYPSLKEPKFKKPKNPQDPQEELVECLPMTQAEPLEITNRPVILITHGWMGNKEDHYHQATYLAKMGMVAMVYSTMQNKNPLASPNWWSDAYEDMYRSFKLENSLPKSPVYNKLNFQNLNLMGHSMGGGGLFYFMDKHPNLKFKTIIALAPYKAPVVSYAGAKMPTPILILGGSKDGVANIGLQENYYAEVPKTTLKVLLEIAQLGHNDYGNQGSKEIHKIVDKYIQDWVKIFVFNQPQSTTLYTKSSLQQLKQKQELTDYKTNKLFD